MIFPRRVRQRLPLFVFGIFRAYNVHVFPTLPSYALAPITELLDTTSHLHASDLRSRDHATSLGAIDPEISEGRKKRRLRIAGSACARAQTAALACSAIDGMTGDRMRSIEDNSWACCSG